MNQLDKWYEEEFRMTAKQIAQTIVEVQNGMQYGQPMQCPCRWTDDGLIEQEGILFTIDEWAAGPWLDACFCGSPRITAEAVSAYAILREYGRADGDDYIASCVRIYSIMWDLLYTRQPAPTLCVNDPNVDRLDDERRKECSTHGEMQKERYK